MKELVLGSCGCPVTVHEANCPHHEHVWVKDYYYADNPTDEMMWCSICHKTQAQLRREAQAAREHAESHRLGANDGYA